MLQMGMLQTDMQMLLFRESLLARRLLRWLGLLIQMYKALGGEGPPYIAEITSINFL